MTIGLPAGAAKAVGKNPSHSKEKTAKTTIPNLSHLSIGHPPLIIFFLGPLFQDLPESPYPCNGGPLTPSMGECKRVTPSDVMNFSGFFSMFPRVRAIFVFSPASSWCTKYTSQMSMSNISFSLSGTQ
jgi:hypothetical protein